MTIKVFDFHVYIDETCNHIHCLVILHIHYFHWIGTYYPPLCSKLGLFKILGFQQEHYHKSSSYCCVMLFFKFKLLNGK